MSKPVNALLGGHLSYFGRLVCVWGVKMGMRASKLDAMRPREPIASPWEPNAELGLRIVEEARIHITMQPKVNLAEGKICGFEAFASPELDGLRIPASIFVPAIEAAKLEGRFDWRVLEAGFALAASAGADEQAPISFNVSPVTMASDSFADRLGQLAESCGASLPGMKIEVLEKMPLNFIKRMRMRVEIFKARKAGFHFSIDDFGTGDANCDMLRLPAEELKIDAFYVRALSTPQGQGWINAMVRLGKAKGMSVCAEGVEHEWQALALAKLGVDVGQGYLWYRPVEALEALALGQGLKKLAEAPLEEVALAARLRWRRAGPRSAISQPRPA
jgi:EAL domain-containing protein (putative c-di-GMP-specific phosphodiesterase class I)